MRNVVKTARHWLAVAWFWPLVLLVLPNCSFKPGAASTSTPPPPGPNLNQGTAPFSSVVFCDIEQQNMRHCASPAEISQGVPIQSGAVALNNGSTSGIALDYSSAALTTCNGQPQAVILYAMFPQGYASCVSATDIGPGDPYASADTLCVAQCEDFFGTTNPDNSITPTNPPDPAIAAWCMANAHASTNFPETPLTSPLNFTGACTDAGAFNTGFADPRRAQELVAWQDLIGVTASGNTLTKTAGSTTAFDAGADSSEAITKGDAYVEFSSGENTTAKFAGLSTGLPGDTDPGFTHIGFAIELSNDQTLSIWESGNEVAHQVAAYSAGDHFRVNVHANTDGVTATITYTRIVGMCIAGQACNEQPVFTSTAQPPYPFRVDTSFEDLNGTLTAQLVRIHQ